MSENPKRVFKHVTGDLAKASQDTRHWLRTEFAGRGIEQAHIEQAGAGYRLRLVLPERTTYLTGVLSMVDIMDLARRWYSFTNTDWYVDGFKMAAIWYEAPNAEDAIKTLCQQRVRESARQVIEAETPKSVFRRISDPNDLEAQLRRIQREEEIEATPHEDSWGPGQRIRRTQHNVFGARPHGGNPNDIGDTGTVVRFLRRLPEPARAEYMCYWDRHPISSEYTDHNRAEAIPGEIDQLDDWGRPPVRPFR